MPDDRSQSHDAVTTPVGVTTICPQCGVVLDALTTTCGACGAVITGAGLHGERAERVRVKLQDAIGEAFVLGDLLGRGGMGIVFRAREVALDRDVALKVLAFDPVLNPEAYARFEREAKLAARLDHPNIVPIFSVGQRNAVAFYTMRLVKGGSVEQMVTPGRGLDVPHAIAILRDVASALDFAHANGVVHRDIKPANILIGDSGHAMVADFGIARAFGGSTGATATGTGIVGSPAYMSPEQWRGEKVDGRADQYALGVLAFELLSGKRPFADASMQELLRMHLAEDPPDIISFREDLPSHVTDAIWRAMAKTPAGRFGSAGAFVNALAAEGRSAAATSRTPIPRVREAPVPARARGRWMVAALVLAVGGLAGLIINENRKLKPSAAPPAPNADSIAAAQKAQSDENARLQRELQEARRIALEAERKVEQLATQRGATGANPTSPEPVHAHLVVVVRGGSPQVWVDGAKVADATPAAIELAPGRHTVAVRGGQEFVPAEHSVELAPNDTQQVVFTSRVLAEGERAGAPPGFGGRTGRFQGPTPPQVIQKLGFDPQTKEPATWTPQERMRFQRLIQQMRADSTGARGRRPPR